MLAPKILSRGVFPIRSIAVEIRDHHWCATPDYDALVTAEWERLLQCPHPVWDGSYYRVLNPATLENETEARTFTLGSISYRYIATYNALHEIHARSALLPLNHLSTIALILTRDGFYVFGRRARIGTVDLIGGGVQPDEIAVSTGADIEQNLYKEMREEIGISGSDIENLVAIGIAQAGNSNILVVGHARAGVSKREIEAGFKSRTEEEMEDLVFVPNDELAPFLRSMPDYRRLLPSLLNNQGRIH